MQKLTPEQYETIQQIIDDTGFSNLISAICAYAIKVQEVAPDEPCKQYADAIVEILATCGCELHNIES